MAEATSSGIDFMTTFETCTTFLDLAGYTLTERMIALTLIPQIAFGNSNIVSAVAIEIFSALQKDECKIEGTTLNSKHQTRAEQFAKVSKSFHELRKVSPEYFDKEARMYLHRFELREYADVMASEEDPSSEPTEARVSEEAQP